MNSFDNASLRASPPSRYRLLYLFLFLFLTFSNANSIITPVRSRSTTPTTESFRSPGPSVIAGRQSQSIAVLETHRDHILSLVHPLVHPHGTRKAPTPTSLLRLCLCQSPPRSTSIASRINPAGGTLIQGLRLLGLRQSGMKKENHGVIVIRHLTAHTVLNIQPPLVNTTVGLSPLLSIHPR